MLLASVAGAMTRGKGNAMRTLKIGDVTITSIIERDGRGGSQRTCFPPMIRTWVVVTWRRWIARCTNPASNRMVITYQTFVVRTPHHTILVDTCTGGGQGLSRADGFSEAALARWVESRGAEVRGYRLRFLHASAHRSTCGWNTVLRNGRWVPTFPKAKYIFHKREYAALGGGHGARGPATRRCLAFRLRADRRGGPGAAGR